MVQRMASPTLKSPIEGSFLDSIKMQPESFMASTELYDDSKTSVD